MEWRKRGFMVLVLMLAMATITPFVQAAPVIWSSSCGGNNHYYDLVSTSSWTDWTKDYSAAQGLTYNGMPGYLATITSNAENQFILDTFKSSGERLVFIGGRDLGGINSSQEGIWLWYNGPEEGNQFWQGGASGSATAPYYFANWASQDPGGGVNANYAAMSLLTGTWYDTNNGGYSGGPVWVTGYIVEYSAPVPIPGALILFGSGLIGLAGLRKRVKN